MSELVFTDKQPNYLPEVVDHASTKHDRLVLLAKPNERARKQNRAGNSDKRALQAELRVLVQHEVAPQAQLAQETSSVHVVQVEASVDGDFELLIHLCQGFTQIARVFYMKHKKI